jgi:hypothetical protein
LVACQLKLAILLESFFGVGCFLLHCIDIMILQTI